MTQSANEAVRPGRQSPPPKGSKVLVKLAIGRLLIDTQIAGLPFEVSQSETDGRWTLAIRGVEAEQAEYIKANARYLNLFYFEGLPASEGAVQKFWMYDLNEPIVRYEAEDALLAISVDSYMAYSNERV